MLRKLKKGLSFLTSRTGPPQGCFQDQMRYRTWQQVRGSGLSRFAGYCCSLFLEGECRPSPLAQLPPNSTLRVLAGKPGRPGMPVCTKGMWGQDY